MASHYLHHNDTEPTQVNQGEQMHEHGHNHGPAPAVEQTNNGCCNGSACDCDDSCLEQLARAICANDAGHIHEHMSNEHTASDDPMDCTTCCSNLDTMSSGIYSNETLAPEQGCLDMKASGVELSENGGECTHGLRSRHTARTDSPTNVEPLPSEACGQHKMFARRKRYQDTLAMFGCVCRAMLAHGLQSCCTTKHAHNNHSSLRLVRSIYSSRAPSVTSARSRKSVDSHCKGNGCCTSERPSTGSHYDKAVSRSSRVSVDSCCDGDGCCGASKPSMEHNSASRISLDSCCRDGQCDVVKSGQEVYGSENAHEKIPVAGSGHIEVEISQKATITPDQHAVLAIRGMTCTGCENKMIRVLRAIPAIHNVKTSLVLCRAEFDFDTSVADLQELVHVIATRTGFSIETIEADKTRDLQFTVQRLLLSGFLAMPLPKGVERAIRINKDTVHIEYDPETTGARDVMRAYETFSPILAPEPPDPAITAGRKHIRTLTLRTVTSALLTIPVLVMAWAPLPPNPHAYSIASLVLATAVQTAITGPVYVGAFKSLFFSGLVETDLLIVLSTTAAYVYSVVAFAFSIRGHPLESGEFFETSTLLVTLIILGQLVSACARQRAITMISIRALQQETATLVHANGLEEVINARLLHYNDHIKIAPDEAVITDGVVRDGQSEVDESMMTGESRPVAKVVGSKVIAGTVNGPSSLLVEVTRLPGENTISDIASMVDDARFSRARVQATVDRICGWFVPVVLLVAIATFLVWLAVGLAVRKQSGAEAAVTALTYAIAALAISCPCAIGLAVPMVILIAGGVAAKNGLVFKAATTIESARDITHVVFDKTGTLTQGRLSVVASEIFDMPIFNARAAISELVKSSKHPVARAVAAYLGSAANDEKTDVSGIEVVTGLGIQGSIAGGIIRGGSASWLESINHPVVAPILGQGLTTFCVTYDGQLVAAFGLEDALRPEARFVVATLKARNIGVSILSGDHPAAVCTVADSLSIPGDNVKSACMPVDKQAYIKALIATQEKVLFCGDGTNDAIALAQANIGVHLHTGEGAGFAASTAADVVLTHPSLTGILILLELSEAVQRRIMLNFVWSAIYNLVAILFAAGAFVRARIAPAYAGLGEIVSVLPVVLVALQLKWFKPSA